MMPTPRNDRRQRLKASDNQETGTDGPVRQCAVTRESWTQDCMIRFVRSPDGIAVPDVAGKLPGRGAWVKADRETVDAAVKQGVFARAFKQKTTAEAGLSDLVERQLLQRCLNYLGMSRKAGEVVIGFDQVRAYLRNEAPGILLEASDGSEDGRNKVHFLAKAIYETPQTAGALTSAELGMAFGRPHVIHALLQQGALCEAFKDAYWRLTGFRPAPERDWFSGLKR
ncbi:MAG TPA: RNA-binding protein [Henriciella marina]|nr:RNA-binding protein [Henriciella sp.]HIG23940.1 RNA-binding protein [Henriciella sp.]HIK65254.1 RNA-binding protein [Henriciella marina]